MQMAKRELRAVGADEKLEFSVIGAKINERESSGEGYNENRM